MEQIFTTFEGGLTFEAPPKITPIEEPETKTLPASDSETKIDSDNDVLPESVVTILKKNHLKRNSLSMRTMKMARYAALPVVYPLQSTVNGFSHAIKTVPWIPRMTKHVIKTVNSYLPGVIAKPVEKVLEIHCSVLTFAQKVTFSVFGKLR